MSATILASDACGCCDGVQASTPQLLFNRPALSQVGYRIGTWVDFKASLTAGLSSAERPALARLLTRDGDDFTLGLVDAFACCADVLTFYQERTANESWLRTAVERVSLQEMGRLIGYTLRPGVAAQTWLAFTLEPVPVAPAGMADEAGSFVTGVPSSTALKAGLKVQSVPGPDEKPQVFETVETLDDARATWNAVRPWLSEPVAPARGDKVAYLAGVRTGLRPGDAVLLVDEDFIDNPAAGGDRWDFRVLSAVAPDLAADRTRIEWARGLGSVNPFKNPAARPRLFALRKRAAAFGHNAPMWASMPAVFKDVYPGGKTGSTYASDWPNFVASARAPGDTIAWIDLDSVQNDVAAGGLAVLAKGDFNHPQGGSGDTYVELYEVRATSEVSRAAFALSGKVTRLELRGENFAAEFYAHPRELSVFAVSEELALTEVPVSADLVGDLLPLDLPADGLQPGRRLIIRGDGAADGAPRVHFSTIDSVTPQATRCLVRIAEALPVALRRDSVIVHANVALASHGESVTQILGSGNAGQAFARYELKQLPLTYRAAATESGAAAELTLRVGGVQWQPRSTMFGAGTAEQAYTLETDAADRLWVRFGDGVRGARVPSGQNNLVATYRKGLGAAGNVRGDTLTQLSSRPLGLKGVANPKAALGGTEPEIEATARRSMPMTTRTLGRVVSLLDYEDFARAYAGISKAQAAVLALRGGRTIVVTVAAENGAAIDSTSPVWANLLDALQAAGDPLVKVQLLAARLSTMQVGLKVLCDPAYDPDSVLAGVEAALRAAFAFDARELAQPVQQSEVIATAQAVPGVLAVDLDLLYGGTAPVAQTLPSLQGRLLASRARVDASGQPREAELLTLDPGPLAALGVMT